MRGLALLLLSLAGAQANDLLWTRIKAEPNIVILTRHMQSGGGKGLVWDQSGACAGEARLTSAGRADAQKLGALFAGQAIKPLVISSPMCRCLETARIAFGEPLADPDLREIASADTERLRAFNQKATTLLLQHRGHTPIVFVSHRPNIELLTLELVEEAELVVGRISDNGEIEVLGKMRVPGTVLNP